MTNPIPGFNLSRKVLHSALGVAALSAAICTGMLNAQSPAPSPLTFDLATIKVSGDKRTPPSLRTHPRGIDITTYPLRSLIAEAYGVSRASIGVAASARVTDVLDQLYDISARADREPSRPELLKMLQSLLADRFKLTLRRESKEEKIYKLNVAPGGPKLETTAKTFAPACAMGAEGGAVCHNASMIFFSGYLSERMGRTVVDGTGLIGNYDFVLRLEGTPGYNAIKTAIESGTEPGDVKRNMAAASRDWTGSSIFTDLPKQLGLKLEADKGPVEHLVIDRLEKPSAN